MPARNSELEGQIAKSPGDPAPYLVYADWLAEKGDPRGELITLSVALEKDPANTKLAERAQALHADHDAEWLAGVAGQDAIAVTWKYGFLESARLGGAGDYDDTPEVELGELYAKLAPLPSAALLRDLTFGAFGNDDGEPTWHASWLVDHGVSPALRRLAFDKGGYWDISWTYLDSLQPVYPLVPNLDTLYIKMGHMDFGEIDLPQLRDFEVYTGGFSAENMASVLAAKWPQLERLILRFGNQEDYGASCELSHVLPLLENPRTPKLKHLGLGNSGFADELIEPLARSPLLRQLETLDLSLGMLSDTGAALLAKHADAFKHLERIDVHQNYLSSDGLGTVTSALKQTEGSEQKQGDDYRYCSISE